MDARKSWRKVGFWAGGLLAGLLVIYTGLRVGVGYYLNTKAGKETVARKLEAMIGLPVEVSDVQLGSSTSTVKFRILDPALAGRPDAEVLSVESASADVSFSDFLTGQSQPTQLTLRGVRLTLRLDADGKILTTLPAQTSTGFGGGNVPTVKLEDGHVRIRQDGKPEFSMSLVSFHLTPKGDRLWLDGAIEDPAWGKWTATGEIDKLARSGWVELGSERVTLATERLRSIPFVPVSLWEHVHPEGDSSVRLRLTYNPEVEVKYEASIQPRGLTLGVPDADIALTDVTGRIRVNGNRVELNGCKAKLAGGTVVANGFAVFGSKTSEVRVSLKADGLDVNKVPAEWGVPKDFGGKLQGQALIHLLIDADGRINPSGSVGQGKIVEAKVRGFDADVDLHLRPEGEKLKLNPGQSPNAVPQIGVGSVSRGRVVDSIAAIAAGNP
jgi:uncharacterized protein YhdP